MGVMVGNLVQKKDMKLFLEALALGKGITLERLGHGNLN
jgi:hypothetical protein